MVLGAARLQHLEIFLLKPLVPFLVNRIKRVYQAVAEGIGIDVEWRVDEVGYVGPEGFIAFDKVEHGAKAFGLHRHPQRVDVIRCQLTLGAGRVQFALEIVEGDLAHHGVDHILDLARQQHFALLLRLCLLQQFAEGQHLAEHRCGFGQCQRGRGQQFALIRRQHLMHTVAQLVGQGHHIARLAQIVQHHIGVHRGDGGVGECARRLAGFHAGINPAVSEKRFGNFGHARIKGGIGLHYGAFGLRPIHSLGALHRQGGVAVPDLHCIQPQPFGLQRIVTVRQLGVGGHNRVAQRLDHLRLYMVRQVPRGLRGRHFAPLVLDRLFLGQCVVDP